MPKANNKDVYYFSHDCNARNDEKILAMRSIYGLEGYAMYFMLIEILREQKDYKLKQTKYIYNSLAMQFNADVQRVKEFLNDCINEFDLLVENDGYIYSASLLQRMNLYSEISEKRSKAAQKRWENANALQMQCTCSANGIQDYANKTKLKETKLKENKINNINNNNTLSGDNLKSDFPLSKSNRDF